MYSKDGKFPTLPPFTLALGEGAFPSGICMSPPPLTAMESCQMELPKKLLENIDADKSARSPFGGALAQPPSSGIACTGVKRVWARIDNYAYRSIRLN